MDKELRAAARAHLNRYGQGDVDRLYVAARGATVRDDEGREILDFTSGQMCATLGQVIRPWSRRFNRVPRTRFTCSPA